MQKIEKTALFLLMIGTEKGQKVIALMDTVEIKAIVTVMRRLGPASPAIQKEIRQEFERLGYLPEMNAVEILTMIRFLFGGSRIDREIYR